MSSGNVKRKWREKKKVQKPTRQKSQRNMHWLFQADKYSFNSLKIEIACCSAELPTELLELLISWFRKCRPRLIQYPATYTVDWVDIATCPVGCSWSFTWSSNYPGSDSLQNWLRVVTGNNNIDYLSKWFCPGCRNLFTLVFLR